MVSLNNLLALNLGFLFSNQMPHLVGLSHSYPLSTSFSGTSLDTLFLTVFGLNYTATKQTECKRPNGHFKSGGTGLSEVV